MLEVRELNATALVHDLRRSLKCLLAEYCIRRLPDVLIFPAPIGTRAHLSRQLIHI